MYDRFVDGYRRKLESLTVGDPKDPATILGSLITESQAVELVAAVDDAIAGGATALIRGERKGTLVLPSILADVTPDMPVAQCELFGPVALMMAANGDDDAVRIANDTPYGLSGAVHSRDIDRAVRVARRIETGMIHVNDATIHDEPNVPFGGEKMSGLGRLNGDRSLDKFSTLKWVSVNHGRRQFPY